MKLITKISILVWIVLLYACSAQNNPPPSKPSGSGAELSTINSKRLEEAKNNSGDIHTLSNFSTAAATPLADKSTSPPALVQNSPAKDESSTAQQTPNTPNTPKKPQEEQSRTISIIGVGDIMFGTNYPSKRYLPSNRGKNLLPKYVNDILKGADITFGNLEGTILNKGPTIKHCKKCYSFRMPEFLADNLVTAGFDVVSIANNHARDFGQRGLKNTIKVLTKLKIETAGLLTRPSATFEKDGIKYGFAAFAPNIGTVSINDIPNAKKIVRELAETNDIVIVSFHGGAEGTRHQHVPKRNEYFYGENRGNVHKFAHAVIDAGADIIFGHGPHVPRAVEVYNKRFIAYSLGNFCTYGRFSLRGVTKIAPLIKVNVDQKGQFIDGKIYPFKQIKGRGVRRDSRKQAISIIRRLTKADGFLSNIKIDRNGLISYKSEQ